jgi:23S rRNA (pseudouridine1915-N3)-methyltransferase
LQLQFVWVGATKDKYFSRLEERYLKRIRQHLPARRAVVPELPKQDRRQQKSALEKEGAALERRIVQGATVVALDERGRETSSKELAELLSRHMVGGTRHLAFLVGGHAGLPAAILDRSHLSLSLSRLTLPHELARVFLLEQIYRSICIIKRLPYHR